MKRLAAVAVLSLLATGCNAFADDSAGGGDADVTVAAAFYPLAWVAERVAGDHAGVELLTQPGGEPHDLELDIEQTATITDADLVLYEADFQPSVDDAVEQNAGGATLDAAAVVGLQPFADDEHGHDEHGDEHADEEGDHHEDDGHDHEGDLDPHFWLDPIRMAELGDAVADQLADIDGDHADDYRANAESLRSDLEELDGELEEGLAQCERSTIVVSHDAFGYLDEYGLDVAPVAGLSPEAEPTTAVLADLQQLIEDDGITTVFSERLASPRFTEALADDAGITTAILDPIEGLSDETADEDYLSLMRENLTALRTANGCE
jgi:zinc transport system substrate-binding protein